MRGNLAKGSKDAGPMESKAGEQAQLIWPSPLPSCRQTCTGFVPLSASKFCDYRIAGEITQATPPSG